MSLSFFCWPFMYHWLFPFVLTKYAQFYRKYMYFFAIVFLKLWGEVLNCVFVFLHKYIQKCAAVVHTFCTCADTTTTTLRTHPLSYSCPLRRLSSLYFDASTSCPSFAGSSGASGFWPDNPVLSKLRWATLGHQSGPHPPHSARLRDVENVQKTALYRFENI